MEESVVKVEKSYKFEGYCFVTVQYPTGKQYTFKRKVYERKTGKLAGKNIFNLKTNVYSFVWDVTGKEGQDISFLGQYKSLIELDKYNEADAEPEKLPEVKYEDGEVRHSKYGEIKACIQANIPVYLAGPAGSGKNYTLEQIAKDLDMDFYFTNSVQQEYKITGFIDAGGIYHETEFYKAFKNGGLFFLDEMDASIPEVLVLLNAAIANGYFEFPNGKITANKGFRVVAAGNTVGNGADEEYTGRLVLDSATLDRFAIIEFGYDFNIELHIAKGNIELVNFVDGLRKEAEDKGIRATFSYRCISMVTKLEGKLPLKEIIKIAIVKGLDKDTIRNLTGNSSKYGEALSQVAACA